MISFKNKTQHDNYSELQTSSVGTAVAPARCYLNVLHVSLHHWKTILFYQATNQLDSLKKRNNKTFMQRKRTKIRSYDSLC